MSLSRRRDFFLFSGKTDESKRQFGKSERQNDDEKPLVANSTISQPPSMGNPKIPMKYAMTNHVRAAERSGDGASLTVWV